MPASSSRVPVSIATVGAADEAFTLRAVLESFGAVVQLHLPGTHGDFLKVIQPEQDIPPYLIISGHGDGNGLVFGEYGEGIDTGMLANGVMRPEVITPCLPRSAVISTFCMGGSKKMATAFLRGGAVTYIGAEGYPDGQDAFLFVIHLSYGLIKGGDTVEAGWHKAASYNQAFAMFVMYNRDGVHRVSPYVQGG